MESGARLLNGALGRLGLAIAGRAPTDTLIDLPPRPFTPPKSPAEAAFAGLRLSEFDLDYDAEEKVLWCYFNFRGRPCFSPTVLEEAQRIQAQVRAVSVEHTGQELPVRYLVLGSRFPGVWNLGGDLALFAELIRRRDRSALLRYARACCDVGYTNSTLYDLPVVSIALVQGEALGGGFEAVLSSNVIVAERSARFGLPEILFNLFPGMGAYSFLARRIAPGLAERMILSGEIYTAERLYELGVVDVLAADGEGMDAVHAYIGRHGRRHAAHAAVRGARQIVSPVSMEEMMRIAELWVDAALKLTEADLRKMQRLAAAQDRRRAREAAAS